MKVPETFISGKELEEKIDELAKKVEELESNCVISTTCCMHKTKNIILKFEKGQPAGIICSAYKHPGHDYSCWEGSKEECVYLSGFKSLKADKEDYKK